MTIHDFDMARFLVGAEMEAVYAAGGVMVDPAIGAVGDIDYPNTAVISDAHRIHRGLPLNFFMERYTQSYVNEIKAFVNGVLNDTPPPVTGLDGRIPVVMGLAAAKSLAERRLVRLDEVSWKNVDREVWSLMRSCAR